MARRVEARRPGGLEHGRTRVGSAAPTSASKMVNMPGAADALRKGGTFLCNDPIAGSPPVVALVDRMRHRRGSALPKLLPCPCAHRTKKGLFADLPKKETDAAVADSLVAVRAQGVQACVRPGCALG